VDDADLRDLAVKTAEGDVNAAEELMRGAHDYIFGLLYLLGVPQDDVDDLGQEAALQIYASIPKYDPSQPFLPWMRGIVRHVAAHHWRRTARRDRREEAFQEYVTEEVLPDDSLGDILDLRLERLAACVERLKEKQRRLIQMRYNENLGSNEIAKSVGMTVLSVRTVLTRIRNALRRCVDRAEPAAARQES
jgi:RNA polymerase sigma-70 factor (ECF subfamily)